MPKKAATVPDERIADTGIARRLGGFAVLPLLSALLPLAFLPIVARIGGVGGWTSIGIGQALGNAAGVVVMFGWWGLGPARYASAGTTRERRELYASSLVSRSWILATVSPFLFLASWMIAAPGHRLDCTLMAFAMALSGLSPNWYFIGAGKPWSIAKYETIPKLLCLIIVLLPILLSRQIWLYPAALAISSAMNIGLASRSILGNVRIVEKPRDTLRELRRQATIALSSTVGSLYTATPLPIASRGSSIDALAAFTSADRIYRYSLYSVVALGNALQSWTLEAQGDRRRQRQIKSVAMHGVLGITGGVSIVALGPFVTRTLFGTDLAAGRDVMIGFAIAFACTSTSTPCIRNILLPAGAKWRVLLGTVSGACVGIPLMIIGVSTKGVAFVSLGLGISEFTALAIIAAGSIRCLKLEKHSTRAGDQ